MDTISKEQMIPLKRIKVNVSFVPYSTTERIKKSILFVDSGVKNYFNAQHLLYKLNKNERAFYDYLCEVMTTKNSITINAVLRIQFADHFFRVVKKQIPDSSITKFVAKLNDLGMIILIGNQRSAFYNINPRYAFKGSKIARANLLRKLIQDRGKAGLPLIGLINIPDAEFLNQTA